MTELPPPPSFDAMKLGEPVLRALQDVGYTQPTSVQLATFDAVAEGRDVIVQSPTGSGKTAAFAIPLIDRVIRNEAVLQVLVLCPTRELAVQVANEFERLGRHNGVSIAAIYGGVSMQPQTDALRAGARVVVGTPGRVLDHIRRKTLDPSRLRAVVLDEGDEMLSMGFAEEINAILEALPKSRQGLIFSATMPDMMQRMAQRHLREPEHIALTSGGNVSPDEIVHAIYLCTSGSRTKDLVRVIELERPEAALVFCNTRNETELVARALQQSGLAAEYLNSDLSQPERERVLGLLRDDKVQYLVATDVAARGIDIPHLTHVINVGLPESTEAYVHRTGRTGRAGRAGTAISLVGPHDIGNLYFIRLAYGIRPVERFLPTSREERTRREQDRLQILLEAFAAPASEDDLAIARRLLTHDDAERVVASLIGTFLDLNRKHALEQSLAQRHRGDATPVAPRAAPEAPAKPAETPAPPPRRREERSADAPRPPRAERPERPRKERSEDRERRRDHGPDRPRRAEAKPQEQAAEPVAEPVTERPQERVAEGAPAHETSNGEARSEDIKLAVGRRDGLRPGDVVRLLTEILKVPKTDVGRIQVRDRITLVGLKSEIIDQALEALREMTWNDRPLSPERGRPAAAEERPSE